MTWRHSAAAACGLFFSNNIILMSCRPTFFWVIKIKKTTFSKDKNEHHIANHHQSPPITTNHPPITSKMWGQSPSNHLRDRSYLAMTWLGKSAKILFWLRCLLSPLFLLALFLCGSLSQSVTCILNSCSPVRCCSVHWLSMVSGFCLRFVLVCFPVDGRCGNNYT